MNEEYEYFTESVMDQLSLIVATAFTTLFVVCIIIAIAVR
jgi:hypothetical protein